MTPVLNEDILTLIYSHIFDFDVLRTAAIASTADKKHPLRTVVLRRLLQLPLCLSSENLDDSTALIDYLVRNDACVGLIRDIAITLGLSGEYIAQSELRGEDVVPMMIEEAEKAEVFIKLLPKLLRRTENLQRLDWSRHSEETLNVLFEHSLVSHISLDCSVQLLEEWEIPNSTTNMGLLFSTIGSKATSLDLRSIDEDSFKAIVEHFPPLKNVRSLKLDLTCGVWDWDGRGSPQQGPSERYKFPRITNHVEELDITISDLLARQRKGPIGLVNPTKLTKLRVEVIPCFTWVCIDFVPLFSDILATDFSSLTHLIIDDSIRDIGGTMTQGDWQEGGRAYVGIHKLVEGLPGLRHLWVNERVLAIPSTDNTLDIWDAKPFNGDSQDSIMSRTVASPQWELLGYAFKKLESLRVGFGPLNVIWVTKVLSICDHTKLKAFGFDWEWKHGCNKPGVFAELIAALSKFESLTDLHILHPYAILHTPIDYSHNSDLRLAAHHLDENEESAGLAMEFLSELPGLYRVGVGRKIVYERQTRWKESDTNEIFVQRVDEAGVPSFYDAGSDMDEWEFDEPPATKDVLKLLEELSV